MDPVTALRPQVLPHAPVPQAPADRLISAPAAQTAPPVTDTLRVDAVRHPAWAAGLVAAPFAERDESGHPATEARAAADAAREAYIRASIAAGINPLPLRGA